MNLEETYQGIPFQFQVDYPKKNNKNKMVVRMWKNLNGFPLDTVISDCVMIKSVDKERYDELVDNIVKDILKSNGVFIKEVSLESVRYALKELKTVGKTMEIHDLYPGMNFVSNGVIRYGVEVEVKNI